MIGTSGPLTVVVGGQAGSEGKGAVTARLAKELNYEWSVRVGGPNAGHTVIGPNGARYALRQIPVAAVVSPDTQLVIAAGSEIDLDVLRGEVNMLEADGFRVRDRLLIDQEATVLHPWHASREQSLQHGTTGKGIGAARAERALRQAQRVKDLNDASLMGVDTQDILRQVARDQRPILLEGTQGYVLGSHAGWYPHCTSGDCRAIDFLAAAGLPPMHADIWVVLRTFPIRIAGNSGPLQKETTWEEVGVEPEITTVTKKVRRVGHWDWEWAKRSVEANTNERAPSIALTFADYWWPELKGENGWWTQEFLDRSIKTEPIRRRVRAIEQEVGGRVKMLGTGPDTQLLLK